MRIYWPCGASDKPNSSRPAAESDFENSGTVLKLTLSKLRSIAMDPAADKATATDATRLFNCTGDETNRPTPSAANVNVVSVAILLFI